MLQEGQAGTDVAMAVARTTANLDTRAAKATSEADRQMIHVPRSRVTRVEHVNKCDAVLQRMPSLCFRDVLPGCCRLVSRLLSLLVICAVCYCVLPLPPCLPALVSFGDLCCGPQ